MHACVCYLHLFDCPLELPHNGFLSLSPFCHTGINHVHNALQMLVVAKDMILIDLCDPRHPLLISGALKKANLLAL